MAAHRVVAVVGARALPEAWALQVAEVVRFFLGRGWGIASGGARGADEYALRAVLAAGRAACARSVVFLPGSLAESRSGLLRTFVRRGGRVVKGSGSGREALLARSRRLARESAGVVAFLWGHLRGSVFTVREAIRAGKPVAVILAGDGAELPSFSGGRREACALCSVRAVRWVAEASEEAEPKPTALARIFVVPEGEPVDALLTHISSLSQGERLWFEQGVLVGDTVLVPHESCLDGKPSRLSLDRLMRRLGCTAREAWELGELLLALEAGAEVVAHYEAQARARGIGVVLQDLYWLVVGLARAEEPSAADAPADTFTPEAWHRLGLIRPEAIRCPGCGAEYEAGVAWSHYQIRKAKLEAALAPGFLACALLQDVERAAARALPRFGAWLYRRQRAKGSMLSAPEWRRIWQAYQARRVARSA